MFEKLAENRAMHSDGYEVWRIDRLNAGYRDEAREAVAGVESSPGRIAIYESVFEWKRGEPLAETAEADRRMILHRVAAAMRFLGYPVTEIVQAEVR